MQIKNTGNIVKKRYVSANVMKNICNYTLNIAPRSVRAYRNGQLQGEYLSKMQNRSRFGTFCCKQSTASKNLIREFKPLEIPAVMSALALPIPIGFASPAAFILGCALVSPIVIKKFLNKELTMADIKEFCEKLKTEDFVKRDKSTRIRSKSQNNN